MNNETNPLGAAGTNQQQQGMHSALNPTDNFNPAGQPIGDANPMGGAGTGQQQRGLGGILGGGSTSSSSGGDMLDKAVDAIEKKTGHNQSVGTTEKISDSIRSGFQKMTGKDIPIKDKEMR